MANRNKRIPKRELEKKQMKQSRQAVWTMLVVAIPTILLALWLGL